MADRIDEMFGQGADPTLYPGSRHTRAAVEKSTMSVPGTSLSDLLDPASWGIPPVQKKIMGKPITLYTLGALANALQRPIVTLRLWEAQGRIPSAPYRAEHVSGPGGKVGRRYYSQRNINDAQMEFYRRGLLGAHRIEWADHEDLVEAVAQRWQEDIDEFLSDAPS